MTLAVELAGLTPRRRAEPHYRSRSSRRKRSSAPVPAREPGWNCASIATCADLAQRLSTTTAGLPIAAQWLLFDPTNLAYGATAKHQMLLQ